MELEEANQVYVNSTAVFRGISLDMETLMRQTESDLKLRDIEVENKKASIRTSYVACVSYLMVYKRLLHLLRSKKV